MTDRWTPFETEDGSWTLECVALGETCHDRAGAWTEARERYALPARLAERARSSAYPRLRLLDIGTGLGWNLAAALAAVGDAPTPLDVWTLEVDRSVIEDALELAARGIGSAALARYYAPVADALAAALDVAPEPVRFGSRGHLHLRLGDARESLTSLPPDLFFDAVFLDPFSPRVDAGLWSEAFLEHVAGRMAAGSLLSTYSASFPVRLNLARAGLVVGAGPGVGHKTEGTLASPDLELPPLAPRMARRLARRLEPGSLRPSATFHVEGA